MFLIYQEQDRAGSVLSYRGFIRSRSGLPAVATMGKNDYPEWSKLAYAEAKAAASSGGDFRAAYERAADKYRPVRGGKHGFSRSSNGVARDRAESLIGVVREQLEVEEHYVSGREKWAGVFVGDSV